MSRGTVCGLSFLLKFWIASDFLQKPLAWFSNFYLRVQSKSSWRIVFFILLFRVCSDFERKFFQTFGQKTSRSFQNYLPSVLRNSLWLEFFFKFWIASDFLQKPLSWFSNFYLRVQSKNSGGIVFSILLFRVCSDFERKFFQTFGQKTSRSFQNYLLSVQRNSLWLEIFF